ncbi:MAG: hypothetical protein IH609_12140 [Dehalococcoidia bacterium]|nr:hypothetical protein [Dehalococcoidia bacterium]
MFGKRFRTGTKTVTLSAEELGCGQFDFNIVGESKYQNEIKAAAEKANRNARGYLQFRAVIVLEPENRFDPNAIAVYAEGGGKLGYFSREDAVQQNSPLRRLAARRKAACCQAIIVGEQQPSLGVVLDYDDTGTWL